MIEIGKIYRLNAPWHHRHGRLVFVVHSREGVSPDYAGRTIYHIVDSDDFSTEPDWETEYVESHLSEYPFDVKLFLDDSIKKRMSSLINNIMESQARFSTNTIKLPGLIQSRIVFSVNVKHGEPSITTMLVILGADNFYSQIPDKYFSVEQIRNLTGYYDDDSNFIELEPPN